MDKFPDAYDQPKLNQEDKNYLNCSIESNEIEAAIVFPKRKTQYPIHLLLNSTRPLKNSCIYTMESYSAIRRMKVCNSQVNGCNRRASC
jgi:hypothetical protein